ncbi:hypothetical protein H257_15400 [Aphanomyces astaci]|uniref:Uncharacterized protein n=1 Tax=Aphanomyces astaci TaxID=112090 RepID=W4FPV9_APHAT|nr:hypothetical protein H257_15400 [Aphanomyces astaci]ETV68859.1 hypothetical protein H257_15400 [Aphanomyces astaci]|eukprot:XP_009841813.1 hypothetical protein H257_15400 [Aphanomyces astaci]
MALLQERVTGIQEERVCRSKASLHRPRGHRYRRQRTSTRSQHYARHGQRYWDIGDHTLPPIEVLDDQPSIVPTEKDASKFERLAFCGAYVNIQMECMNDNLSNRMGDAAIEAELTALSDMAYLDDKWFNADKDSGKTYVTKGDYDRCACKSKRFIPMVMLLADVARPRLEAGFDGPSLSKNGPDETPTYRDYAVNKVVLSIKERFLSRRLMRHIRQPKPRSLGHCSAAINTVVGELYQRVGWCGNLCFN